ncbi:uncharacterized protein LOC109526302 [Hippocampus comes]|uniref:uncharacterized protein LOC109526302 n=1 Tax=Hippocampus comes TaxID=109280 RepID=UPI00094EF25A|nr:PREDICTED: uncharacterized protein LOC109526302 [Hippocampus comes]
MSSSSTDQTVTADSQHIAMETYWQELESMGEEQEQEEEEEEERQSIDELRPEEAWLTEAGLSTLLASSSEEASPAAQAPPPAQALSATLTRRQTHTVETRLRNYRQAVTHVKDIFASHLEPVVSCGPRSPSSQSAANQVDHQNHPETEQVSAPRPFLVPLRRGASAPARLLHARLGRASSAAPGVPVASRRPTKSTTKTIRKQSKSAPPGLSSFRYDAEPLRPPAFSTRASAARADRSPRDRPYSDGVAEHRGGGTCRDCLPDRAGDVPVSVTFAFACPWQGATRADDLSSDDMKRPGFVCHIELSTFLLALGVRSKRTRPRRTRNGGAPPRSSPRLVVLLSQLRRMNQASNPKPGLLLRARTDKNKKQVTELCEGIFKVHAPLRSKASVAIQLDRRVTAKDVTARFMPAVSAQRRLFRVGGNIGERRLRPDCLPLDVYHANPGCHWLVKPRGDDRRRRRRPSHVDQRLCS